MRTGISQKPDARLEFIARTSFIGICLLWMLLSMAGNVAAQSVPTLGGILPHTTTPGGPGFVLTALGSNYTSNSVIQWNGFDRATTYVDEHELRANILAGDIASPGTAAVAVSTPGVGVSTTVSFSIQGFPPMLGGLDPGSAEAGGPGFVLTAIGTFFEGDSIVQWNGNNRTTTFVSDSQLNADILESDIAAEGTANVTVFTPGFGNSDPRVFYITPAIGSTPTLHHLEPSSIHAGEPGFILEVGGWNFAENSVIQWNGLSRETTFIFSNVLRAIIPASDIASAGSASITVSTPGAPLSNALIFQIVPFSTGFYAQFNPTSAPPGGPGFVLYASGTYCLSNSVIQWNGSPRSTVFVTQGTIRADIPASDIATAGNAVLTVYTPGQGTSTPITFQIASPPPFLHNLVPNSASAEGPGFILMAIGTYASNSTISTFSKESVVNWNGFKRPTTFIDEAHLQATILASDIASPGTAFVTVSTPGAIGSYPIIFNITEPEPAVGLNISAGGAALHSTPGGSGPTQTGYATITNTGSVPFGTAVFRFKNRGITISEVGVSPSPPTQWARVFVDYRSAAAAVPGQADSGTVDVNTGVAIVNYGNSDATVRLVLRKLDGTTIATGNGTIAKANHMARFIDALKDIAPDFVIPSDFQTAIQFGTLDIESDEPLSVTALRGTTNQRGDFLITTTPVSDLTQAPDNKPLYFPQFADGGGYTTSVVLLNTSSLAETGTLQILDDAGLPVTVREVGGSSHSSFQYSIPAGGAYRFQSDGFPSNVKTGWVRLTPDASMLMPVGLGIFSFTSKKVMISETGIAAAVSTNHARLYMDLSDKLSMGIALANPGGTPMSVNVSAFKSDGTTGAGNSQEPLKLEVNGHAAMFVDGLVKDLPADFKGVLDVSSKDSFAALTLRCHTNERDEFLMTTFPIADPNRPALAPILFPHFAEGGGYGTEFIFLSPGGPSSISLEMFGETGNPIDLGDQLTGK
jgi:hypothetical protein